MVFRFVNRSIHNYSNFLSTVKRMSSTNKFALPSRYVGNDKSVWVEYVQLALEYKPLNLGQGFPDYTPPNTVIESLKEVSNSPDPLLYQYTRGFGHPRLVNALSKLYSKIIGRDIDPKMEVLVTSGAYEALYAAITGHIDTGDEAIIIEPFFDCYEPMIKCAGGVCRYIPLKPKPTAGNTTSSADWVYDFNEMESLFNEKTKLIIVNTPHNPVGKVFTEKELNHIADLCKKWNVLCISDEVYEWLVYKPNKHIRMATLPGMWDRTITIGSAGKTFSITGWKCGWAYGPKELMRNLQAVHQNCVYTCTTPIQEALGISFEKEIEKIGKPDSVFTSICEEILPKRDLMAKILIDAGMKPTIPEGGYFMMADWTPLTPLVDLNSETDKYKDYRFTKWMTKNVGLLGIPPSAFYGDVNKPLGEQFVRYCFCKKDENVKKLGDILLKWKSNSKL